MSDSADSVVGSDWGDWFQDIAGNVIKTASQLKVLETVQQGQRGYYVPGQYGVQYANGMPVAGGSSNLLLIAGVVLVAYLVLKA